MKRSDPPENHGDSSAGVQGAEALRKRGRVLDHPLTREDVYKAALEYIAADPTKYGSLGTDGARQVAINALAGRGPFGEEVHP